MSFSGLAGAYAGLATTSGTSVGLFAVSVGPNGGFSAKLTLSGTSYPFTGAFSSSGNYVQTFSIGSNSLIVAMVLDSSSPGVAGVIGDRNGSLFNGYGFLGEPLGAFNAETLPAGLAGSYTVSLPPLTESGMVWMPCGSGRMFVSATGVMLISGTFGDASPFSVGGHLNADGKTCTLFSPLSGGGNPGSIAGTITFGPDGAEGSLEWTRPAQAGGSYPSGFSVSVTLDAVK